MNRFSGSRVGHSTRLLVNLIKADIQQAIKWFLRVYWLLSLSIVDSFAENRRFFCREPTILLLRTDDSFTEHRRLFCRSPMNLLPSTDDSFAFHHEDLGHSINFMPAMLWIWPRWDRASPLVCTLKERKQLLYQVHLSLSPYLLSADP